MNWPFYPFLSGNSGVTPPYAQTPNTNGTFPFNPPWAKPTGGTSVVPFNDRFPALRPNGALATMPKPGLPAIPSASPLAKSSGGGLGALLDMLRPLATSAVAKQGAKSFLGPLATALNVASMVMKPTPMGSEPALYVRDATGNMVPNTANPIVASLMGGNKSPLTPAMAQASPAPVPLPPARPVPMPLSRPPMAGVPVPLPRPRPATPEPNYYYGPGSQNFGVEVPSGNTYGQGPGLLSMLFGK